MPDPKDDVRPPEVEDLQGRPATPGAQGSPEHDLESEGKPGQGINQAGFLKDKDA